jgi:uncharacterized protein (TIGR04222 family)
MNWLIHNPIADIHGPSFLLVYGLIAVAIIAVAYGTVRWRDRTGLREPPPVPDTLDPYELAYLRGGTHAVIHTVLYALHRRGMVTVLKRWFRPGRLVANVDSHNSTSRDTTPLTSLEERVLRAIRSPVEPQDLFQNTALERDIENICTPYRRKLESDELLRTDAAKGAATQIPIAASAALISLALYKVAIAMAEQRPFGFLIILTIVSLVLVWSLVGRAARARVSERGRAYLDRLQLAYGNALRPEARWRGQLSQPGQPDAPSVAMIGLFGMGILSATPDVAFGSLITRNTAADGGGGCGGGAGGGGGCGGGGGGCGG